MRRLNKELPKNESGKVDPRSLASLYPQAKTFTQRADDDAQREKRMLRRQPHFVRFKIALCTSILIVASLLYVSRVHHLWSSGSTIGIFLSFGAALILAFSIIGCLYYVYQMFYYFSRSIVAYFIVELLLVAGAVFLFATLAQANDDELLNALLSICAAHFVSLYAFLLIAIRYSRASM